MNPLSLSDRQLREVPGAAQMVPAEWRSRFLKFCR